MAHLPVTPMWTLGGTGPPTWLLPPYRYAALIDINFANWGDIPTWVSAVGSLFALTFAAVAAVATRRTLRIELERDRATAAARREQEVLRSRTQASAVSAWWAKQDETSGTFVRNASETPIYQVHLVIYSSEDHEKPVSRVDLPVVPPTNEPAFHRAAASESIIDDRRVSLTFTDSSGVRWQRDKYGRLHQLASALRLISEPEYTDALTRFTTDFQASFGVSVDFSQGVHDHDLENLFIEQNHTVDILIGPHDWLGNLVAKQAVEPVILSADKADRFDRRALDAMRVDGILSGLPAMSFTMALLRNKDLVPDPPDTFEQLVEIGQALKDSGRTSEILAVQVGPQGDPFQIWPIFTAAGGELFGRHADGSWDQANVLIDSDTSIAAFERLRVLGVAGSNIINPDIDDVEARRMFLSGTAPFYLATSTQAAKSHRAGINVAAQAWPPFADGRPARGFVGVVGFIVARNAPNKVVAEDFAPDYLTRHDVMDAMQKEAGMVSASRTARPGPFTREFADLCASGDLMPAFPQMVDVWAALGEAEVQILRGADAAATARTLAVRIRDFFR